MAGIETVPALFFCAFYKVQSFCMVCRFLVVAVNPVFFSQKVLLSLVFP